ncbi:MAG TPA: hypothetical protein IAB12_06635 [Candidatus Ornithospirochaeta avicola]|uniref:Uncharacterized protein n=1 Tax=Candidatus Ornithospirochaeta avicola TaxID=2840896 RepID=A0A9D1TNC1_9SPIO|nr:hypothetical protein [Candidatus Ornithospirochaeta avicola]
MIRKTYLLLFVLFITFSSSASDYYRSNALMQKIEEINELALSGYEIEADDEKETLFLDGKEIKSKRYVSENEYEIIDENGEKTAFVFDDEGRLLRRTGAEGTVLYTYAPDGKMISSSDGENIYHYSYSSSGLVSRIDRADLVYLYPSSSDFHYQSREDAYSVKEVGQNLIIFPSSSAFFDTGDGKISIEVENTRYTYSDKGLLLSVSSGESETAYFYDDKPELIKSERRDGESMTAEHYDDGKVVLKETYLNNELTSSYDYRLHEETRYRSGKAYAVLKYMDDDRSLLKIEVL